MAESTQPAAPVAEIETGPQPRRRRNVAFFGVDGPESPVKIDKAAAEEILSKAPEISRPSVLTLIALAIPFLALMVYLFTPPSAPPSATPLAPLLKSLTSLTKLSPALPYTGLATHMLLHTLNSTPNVPANVMKLAEETKIAVEIFSGDDDNFRSETAEGLEQFLSLEKWTEEGMKEGYESLFVGKEAEAEGLVKKAGELKTTLARLGSGLKGFGKEGEPAKIVEWLSLVVGKADEVFKNVGEEARNGRKRVKGFGKGWMGEDLLRRERQAIEKYAKVERKAGELLDAISKEYMEGEVRDAVENRLKKAIEKGIISWW